MNLPNTKIQASETGNSDVKLNDSHKVSQELEDALNAWYGEYLAGVEPLELLPKKNTSEVGRNDQALHTISLDAFLSSRLDLFVSESSIELSSIFLAVWQALIFRYSQKYDLALVIAKNPINHQLTSEPEVLIIRQTITGNDNFETWIGNTNEALASIENIGQIPVSRMTELPKHLNILFGNNSNFYQYGHKKNKPTSKDSIIPDTPPIENATTESPFELSFFIPVDLDNDRTLNLLYNSKLFSLCDIENLLEDYVTLLASALESPSTCISKLNLIKKNKFHGILEGFNNNSKDYPTEKGLTDLLAEQAIKTPDRIAASFENDFLTYSDLMEQVNQMATWLGRFNLEPDSLVGVCQIRGLRLLVTHLAIQHLGAAYLPIDPEYPDDRIEYVLRDALVSLFITSDSLSHISVDASIPILAIENIWDEVLSTTPGPIESKAEPHHRAYVIYTSGSTGNPKGVQNTRANVVNQLMAIRDRTGFDQDDVVLALTTVAFDISVIEFYMPLICGGRTHLISREIAIDGFKLLDTLKTQQISFLQVTPSTWRLLLEAGWDGNSNMTGVVGGEPLPGDLAKQLVPRLKCLWNMYGPTETTVWCTAGEISVDSRPITIGQPLANYQIYILDPDNNICPINVTGEICVSGAGTARGYLNRPEQTAEVYVNNPFSKAESLMYRTGDLGRWLPDGNIECLGRRDNQIKLRGYRIELGEIESSISSHSGVDHAVVNLVKNDQAEFLAAYVVLNDTKTSEQDIVNLISQTLPPYMVPASYTFMEKLPISPNGKVDRKALLAPVVTKTNTLSSNNPPATETEMIVAEMWVSLLNIDTVDREDNFFLLGGHSLLAMKFITKAKTYFESELPVKSLLSASLSQIAELLNPDDALSEDATTTKTEAKNIVSAREATFIDSGDSLLFTIFHSAESQTSIDSKCAILICQPIGHEYQRLQRQVRILATSLAKNGHDVLRFDYAGTGDSTGNPEDMTVQQWRNNILSSLQYLRAISNKKEITGIGIRMGATLLSSCKDLDLSRSVLWDPVTDGEQWINSIQQLTTDAMLDLDRFRFHQTIKNPSELFGYQYNSILLKELGQLKLTEQLDRLPKDTLYLHSESSSTLTNHKDLSAYSKYLTSDVMKIDDNQDWNNSTVADDMIMASNATSTITEWIN